MKKGRNLVLKQNQATEGSPAFPWQFNNQDFVKLRNYCLHQGLLFEDDTFPANSDSIGLNLLPRGTLGKVQWFRPPELVGNPSLFVDGISRFDIIQGEKIGNCWVLAALGSLTQQQQFLGNVIPKDQGFNYTYAGIFHFQFWYFGGWVDVVVDDQLPFLDGKYLSVHPRSTNEFWPPLLEKAYAKLRGSYEKLHFGYISEALVDLTGGVQLPFDLRSPPTHLFEIMKTAALSGSLMACNTPKRASSWFLEHLLPYVPASCLSSKALFQTSWLVKITPSCRIISVVPSSCKMLCQQRLFRTIYTASSELILSNQVLKNGIVQQHVYTVIEAREVPYMDGKEDLIKLWNPWGSVEWNGAWSDQSVEWDRVPQQFKTEFYVKRADGEFWMSFKDFRDNFSYLFVCDNMPTFLDFGEESNTSWSMVQYSNQFSPEGSNYPSALSRNHQYSIKVPEFMMRKNNVVVALTQRPANNSRELGSIGFRIEKDELQGRTTVHAIPPSLRRDVTNDYLLEPGDYIIVPTTSLQSQAPNFLLRIFLKSQGNLREPNMEFSSVMTKHPRGPSISPQGLGEQPDLQGLQHDRRDMLKWNPDDYESIFLSYAYQNSYLDASQLQRILNEVLLKDLMAGLGTGDGFSFDSCKSLLALMDINTNGKLSLQEFERLWRAFRKYEDLFRREDENNSGYLNVSDLQRAVQETGQYVNDELLRLLVMRYGDSAQRINFPDFVCCMFRLETMAKAFHNLSQNRGRIFLTEDEWMTMIMYC
ncbi:calpain-13 [Candoia aspera]|uniref:calpain-13 n=1 Tax=Candoia aspera TaxID=51853 RepID=UPI002FD8042F